MNDESEQEGPIEMKTMQKLRAEVSAREKKVLVYMELVTRLLKEVGEQVSCEQHRDHTRVVKELKDVNGFTFRGIFGQTCMGGNELKVSYDGQDGRRPVFEVYDQVGDFHLGNRFQVNLFDVTLDWQRKLSSMARRKEAVVKQIREQRDRHIAQANSANRAIDEERRQNQELQKRAVRVGL